MNLLKEGDIIRLETGHNVYTQMPGRYWSADPTKEQPIVMLKREATLGAPGTEHLPGLYAVTKTTFDGGGNDGHNRHDAYPNGHHVWCERIDGDKDSNQPVDFYQSGCFTAMNGEIQVVGKSVPGPRINIIF